MTDQHFTRCWFHKISFWFSTPIWLRWSNVMSKFFRSVVQPPTGSVFRLFLYFAPRCTYQVFGALSWGLLNQGTKRQSQHHRGKLKTTRVPTVERKIPSQQFSVSTFGSTFQRARYEQTPLTPDPKHVFFSFFFFSSLYWNCKIKLPCFINHI